MKMLKNILRELLLAMVVGMCIGLALGTLFAIFGAMIGGYLTALNAARSIILIVGAVLLVFSAVLLLKNSNLPEDAFKLRPRKQQTAEDDELFPVQKLNWFRAVPRPYVCLVMAVGILLVSLIPDWLLMYL